MIGKKFLLATFAVAGPLAGFGAMPSKPDFAYPKTVSENAEKQLKTALKADNGPATVRALLDLGLAKAAVNPDDKEKILDIFTQTAAKVKNPVTRAMIGLARADAEEANERDSLVEATVAEFGPVLRKAPSADWKGVIDCEERYYPTLYDFALAQMTELPDSLRREALEFNAANPYPRVAIELRGADGFREYVAVFRRFADSPAGIAPLTLAARSAWELDDRKEAYALATAYGSKSPELDNVIEYLTRPSLEISAETAIQPERPLKVKVSATCLNEASLEVRMNKPQGRLIRTIPLSFDGSGVFRADTVIDVTFGEYGVYRIYPKYSGMDKDEKDKVEVRVTDLMAAQPVYGKDANVMALNATNGAQQTDVTFQRNRSEVTPVRGADRYAPSIWARSGSDPDANARKGANILTDRAIYHPGDRLQFMATLMEARGLSRKLLAGEKVKVELMNANWQTVDTVSLVSDDFGRIEGMFVLPSDGLTGRFQLLIPGYDSAGFMVTDYKAPTFEVDVKAERLDSTTVELRGSAVGYNGFPIADAQIALNVETLPIWVWYRTFRNMGGETVATDTVSTGADGTFSVRVKIPKDTNLLATVTATSPAGESHDATAFIPFHRYHIEANVPAYLEAGKAPAIFLEDIEGRRVDLPLTVILTAADSTTVTPDAAWNNIPSGAYKLTVKAEDAAEYVGEVTVYRRSDKMPPVETALFLPVTAAKPGDKLLLGTSYAESHILLTLWTPKEIIEQRWLTPREGNFTLDITLPDGVDDATLSLFTLRDFDFTEKSVRVSRPDAARALKMEISTIRDKVVPGDTETWDIKVSDNLGHHAPAAVVLDVYSKALDALQPMQWGFDAINTWGKYLRFNHNSIWPSSANASTSRSLFNPMKFLGADFNLWGRTWPFEEEIFYRSFGARRMMAKAAPTNGMLKESAVAMDDMEMDMALPEAAPTEEDAADAGSSETQPADADQYRLPEVPVALWQPVLTTGENGDLRIRFTVPNANTTWAVKGLAYDKQLLAGLFASEFIAAKPVMVQPQLPRFLRVGDRIEMRAMVMNNSADTCDVSAFFEFYNPATEEVIDCREFYMTLDPMASQVIETEYTAPDASMVGVRVRATSGNFTDGEQTIIPILPASVDVRTGRPVFLPSDSATAEIDVPRGGIMTFTANAAWECVASLPGLQTSESKSAFSAVGALFSAATARGLMRQHPEIGLAIKRWAAEDSVLISRLERNDDLKIALLASTPWVGAAQSETEQRARLTLLFDRREVDKVISQSVGTLAKLVRGGGIAWTANATEPSFWVTERVLQTLAQLKRMGYLPADNTLGRIIREGVTYLDTQVARDFAKDKKALFPSYVLLRSQFPAIRQSAPARRAAAATVQHIVGHWRDQSLRGIAQSAIILKENKYPSTAAKLIESLRQYEAWKQLPITPILLEAFAAVEPGCPEVDMIRNEYIARKHSMDWGEGLECSDLIAAILNCGTPWLIPAANELNVKVDGREVDPDAESVMGEFRLNLPEGGRVEISKGRFPAWGGVFSRSNDSITSVEAFASEELKITRTIEGEFKVGNKVKLILELDAAQAMDYVIVRQPRCAALEPVDQLPSTLWLGFLNAYREPCSTVTNWFFNRLAKGKTTISETFYVTAEGDFVLAPAEAQSQYSPEFQAHTEGQAISVKE